MNDELRRILDDIGAAAYAVDVGRRVEFRKIVNSCRRVVMSELAEERAAGMEWALAQIETDVVPGEQRIIKEIDALRTAARLRARRNDGD